MRCFALATLLLVALQLSAMHPALAQSQLERISDWRMDEVRLASTGGAPGTSVPSAPLGAAYNWGYGAPGIGLNLQLPAESSYHAACGIYLNGSLTVLDSIGPFPLPSEWHCGSYHIAAGLPDGRVVVWLTAPGHNPSRVMIGGDYARNTAFHVTATPPSDLSNRWSDWRIHLLSQRNDMDRYLSSVSYDGLGNVLSSLRDTEIPGDLLAVDYIEYPLASGGLPFALLNIRRGTQAAGDNQLSTTFAAWYSANDGWYVQTLRDSGLYNGKLAIGGGAVPWGVIGFDRSQVGDMSGGLQLVTLNPGEGQVLAQVGPEAPIPQPVELQNFALALSAMSSYPLAVVSNGTDVSLGYYINQPRLFEYRFFPIYRGEVYLDGSLEKARYPIFGIAASTHWKSGHPELFWVQQNVNGGGYPSLYRTAFMP